MSSEVGGSSPSVFDRVQELLRRHGVAFQVSRHEPVFTSQQAAAVRGVALASGAKALVCKGDDRFVLIVMPADLMLDGKAVRRARGWKKLRFADRGEVMELTGLEPGAIPPLGSVFGLPTLCDRRLGDNATINFNAGDHRISVSMSYADYLLAESPELGDFARMQTSQA
jgi:Ala-tRNA(Pro) deacylase